MRNKTRHKKKKENDGEKVRPAVSGDANELESTESKTQNTIIQKHVKKFEEIANFFFATFNKYDPAW